MQLLSNKDQAIDEFKKLSNNDTLDFSALNFSGKKNENREINYVYFISFNGFAAETKEAYKGSSLLKIQEASIALIQKICGKQG